MSNPSSKYLTHKYPIWEGCTVAEIGWVSLLSLSLCFILLLLGGFFFQHVHLFLLGMMPALFLVPKMTVKRVASMKENKPYGFLFIQMRLWLEKHVGIKTPYLSRVGHWSTKQ